eukprot:357001-Chlamydomonas_euryale.AAC.6
MRLSLAGRATMSAYRYHPLALQAFIEVLLCPTGIPVWVRSLRRFVCDVWVSSRSGNGAAADVMVALVGVMHTARTPKARIHRPHM